MPSATVTSKGQITIPIEVRRALRLETGDRIDFHKIEDGAYILRPRNRSIMELEGCLPLPDHTITTEEMNQAILDHAAELDARTRSNASGAAPKGEAA